jgi:hypothetical protein
MPSSHCKTPPRSRSAVKSKAAVAAVNPPASRRYEVSDAVLNANRKWSDAYKRASANLYDDAAWEALDWAAEVAERLWLNENHPSRERLVAIYNESRVAYPPGFHRNLLKLRHGDPAAIEPCVQFLERDPHAHRTGYTKADIIRYLNRMELDEVIQSRLRKVILAVVDKADGRREFRSYCRLARKVDSPDLRTELQQRVVLKHVGYRAEAYDVARVKRHAQWVLDALR